MKSLVNIGTGLCLIGIALGIIGLVTSLPLFLIGSVILFIGAILVGIGDTHTKNSSTKEEPEWIKQCNLEIERKEQEKEQYLNWVKTNYKPTKIIEPGVLNSSDIDAYFVLDTENKVVLFGRKIFHFNEIVDVQLDTTTRQTTVQTNKNSPVKRAVVGGILAGGVGAVIGATTAKTSSTTYSREETKGLTLYLNNIASPTHYYPYGHIPRFQEIYSTLVAIVNSNDK